MTEERPGYIASLDGWRAIAVLLVIGAHAARLLKESNTAIGARAASFFQHAGFGVDIFFALSGFLICTLLLREKERGAVDLWAFYRRRVFRIIPPILVYLATLLAISAAGAIAVSTTEVAGVLLFLRNYVAGGWYTGHFWSLAVEEHFYIVVPLVIAFCSRERALRIALVAAIACAVIRFVEWKLQLPGEIEFRTEARFDVLMYGAIFAIAARTPTWRERLERRLSTVVVVALLVVAVGLLICFPAMPMRRTVVALVMPILIGYTVLHPHKAAGRVLNLAWLQYIGRLSYSLYIWQMLFFAPHDDLGWIQSFPGAVIGTAVCALLSYYFVEKPAIAFGRRLAAAWRPAFADSV